MSQDFEKEVNKWARDANLGNTKVSAKRIRSRIWFFTFNNYTKEDTTQLEKYFTDKDTQYVFQEEIGENGTEHLQGCVQFRNAVGIYWQDDLNTRIHWEKGRNWKNSVKYCSKRESRNGKVYTNIEGLEIRKTIKDPLYDVPLYRWQAEVVKHLDTEPNRRTVIWLWDEKGNTGKSTLCLHLALTRKAIVVSGNKKDIFYAIKKADEKRDIDVVLVDIPRSEFNKVSYSAIEGIKNGIISSTKYESETIFINTPHVIVFCNYEPDRSQLSKDRWCIMDLNELR